ncbi:MAG: cytochrome c [Gammaproteobacteria bacterium]|uniref:c-type cytochrome n=1 Tax=Rhodoferax sp. TaxID=50421 RepID=UPI0017C51E9A|nr:cytochrome c [Rhodoferax sp.]MBU3898849.1 cytochrome c [Gammaproteobacteria bacterium]MBA3059471.1 cytochrome c [Rhodoferax sp.]MBU3999040.1 cytochrome c [Gammaproteobacteria bacterium]MBU4019325.1 cytochrome c [Gammaproteobacteria bacterium]MBU4081889.1 cytochrome c [Gammaproteobacteria bacterium]
MRERWVWIVAVASGVLVVLLAWTFAKLQNPTDAVGLEVAAPSLPKLDAALVQAGHRVYQAQGCALCHAVAGEGNPRLPLDGVADRLDAQGLRNWALATGPAATALSARAVRMKESYQELPEADLQALVVWLQTLRRGESAR